MNAHEYYTPLLKNELIPLYEKLLVDVKPYRLKEPGLMPFSVQWGKEFPIEENEGIIFVGQAPNEWISYSENVDALFGDSDQSIFARGDQMIWVEDKKEYTNRTAFWRVVRRLASSIYPNNELDYIAWSNISKIAPEGGNPTPELYKLQIDVCKRILATEIRILSPRVVIFLTNEDWAGDCLNYLGGGEYPPLISETKWEKYSTKLYRCEQLNFILSEHPRGKKETPHYLAIKELLDLII